MPKTVQIPYELFCALVRRHLADLDGDEELIRKLLQEKFDQMLRRELYTTYKTGTPDESEKARQAYLDSIGVPEAFRW